jgi:DNA-binding response OmpR family regulator
MRLLVVEDNEKMAALLARLLADNGFTVDCVGTVEEAEAAIDTATYDAILLDLGLPDGDGGALLRHLRRSGQMIPVLVATARDTVTQRVSTLNEGADDYLVKPFHPEELVARIRALLRRPQEMAATVLTAGNLTLDTTAMMLTVDGTPVELSRRELSVLGALLRCQGRLLPRQRLEETVYSFNDEVTPNAIEAAVSRLRKRLDHAGATVTVTAMRGLGYVLSERSAC